MKTPRKRKGPSQRTRATIRKYLFSKLEQAQCAVLSAEFDLTNKPGYTSTRAHIYWQNVASGIRWCLAGVTPIGGAGNGPALPRSQDGQ